ncbi:MAG: biosynthetic arginine decarboxylase, partial [Thermoanaerobaculia bacterium]
MGAHPTVLMDKDQSTWTIEDAASLYMIDRWGAGYFGVNGNGDMAVAPLQDRGTTIPIIDVVREAKALNLQAPLLIRFQDLVRHRVEVLNNAFNRAITD